MLSSARRTLVLLLVMPEHSASTCQDVANEASVGRAMLQITARSHKLQDEVHEINETVSQPRCKSTLIDIDIEKARLCLPHGIIDKAIRRQAAFIKLSSARKSQQPSITHTVTSAYGAAWANDLNGHFKHECSPGEVLSSIYSTRDSSTEDRLWKFACSQMRSGSLHTCSWTRYTPYGAAWIMGNDDEIITGIESEHSSNSRDRRYRIKSCQVTEAVINNATLEADWRSDNDRILHMNLPSQKFLTKIESIVVNVREARLFKFSTVELDQYSSTSGPISAPTPAPSTAVAPASTPAQTQLPTPAGDHVNVASRAVEGSNVSIDVGGVQPQMEGWFNRIITSMGLQVCSRAHVHGLMLWFSCVPDLDYQDLIDVITDGSPCKYWTDIAAPCPELSDECAGLYCR